MKVIPDKEIVNNIELAIGLRVSLTQIMFKKIPDS